MPTRLARAEVGLHLPLPRIHSILSLNGWVQNDI
jgi:hypothetical protein